MHSPLESVKVTEQRERKKRKKYILISIGIKKVVWIWFVCDIEFTNTTTMSQNCAKCSGLATHC